MATRLTWKFTGLMIPKKSINEIILLSYDSQSPFLDPHPKFESRSLTRKVILASAASSFLPFGLCIIEIVYSVWVSFEKVNIFWQVVRFFYLIYPAYKFVFLMILFSRFFPLKGLRVIETSAADLQDSVDRLTLLIIKVHIFTL